MAGCAFNLLKTTNFDDKVFITLNDVGCNLCCFLLFFPPIHFHFIAKGFTDTSLFGGDYDF
jgi:hypothetical protein